MVQSTARSQRSEEQQPPTVRSARPSLPAYAMSCAVLTLSGTIVARGEVAPRPEGLLADAYSVRLSEIDPPGVLEAMVYSNQPEIILRAEGIPELPLRIDHITGQPGERQFFCVTSKN